MKICVCFKIVPDLDQVLESDWRDISQGLDTSYVKKMINCFDETALEMALRLKETAADTGAACTAVTVGGGLASLMKGLYAVGYDRVVNIPLERREFCPETVAALLAGGGWWTLGRRAARLARQAYIEQLTPGVRGAVLTLSSGENVALEAGGRRMLVEQDGTRLEIAGEELAYHKVEAEQEIPMTNTVTVPRGKEFSLRLSDGTQVWLNSESSLVFPVRFGDGPREVTVTGEAYFDVAHDASRRFVVHADTVSVSVYGTAFNISSYADEGAIETTLVRGSVEVRSGHRRAMLQPGQQARVGREGAIFDVRQVAAEDYAAWTRGLFTFNDETIASICRKLSRWYGVEIVPRGVDADKVRYTGVVKRYETFAEMARLLARTDQIRADVEEGKIVLCIDRDDD